MNDPYFKPTQTLRRIAAAVCAKKAENTVKRKAQGEFHDDEEDISKMDGSELVALWQERNKTYHFEGDTRNLKQLIGAIGYHDFEHFLSDNPGAQEAIIGFIEEWIDRSPEWKEGIVQDIPEADESEAAPQEEPMKEEPNSPFEGLDKTQLPIEE